MTATLEQIAGVALSSLDTLKATYDIARMAIERGVPGDFVECGVFAGAQCAAMAKALYDHADQPHIYGEWPSTRRIHLFDSFTGIPQAGQHDEGWTHPPGTSACSMEYVQERMKEWGIDERLLVYHPGMFADTMIPLDEPSIPRSIAVLRLDGDIYESTRTCLDYLAQFVSPGGWIICDDFALPGARKAMLESGYANGPAYFQVQR